MAGNEGESGDMGRESNWKGVGVLFNELRNVLLSSACIFTRY
jgi:hypothetical protein